MNTVPKYLDLINIFFETIRKLNFVSNYDTSDKKYTENWKKTALNTHFKVTVCHTHTRCS